MVDSLATKHAAVPSAQHRETDARSSPGHRQGNTRAANLRDEAGPLARTARTLNTASVVVAQRALSDRLATRCASSARPAAAGGLPVSLKAGIEALSGLSMDDVRVHRNSAEPAALQAHAHARGTDIHLAPGQDRHLPHEAWHVVQQKQGRVKPTIQLRSGTAINDDVALEREADTMGARAAATVSSERLGPAREAAAPNGSMPVQRTVALRNPENPLLSIPLATLSNPLDPYLTPGGLEFVREWMADETPREFASERALMDAANQAAQDRADQHKVEDDKVKRYYGGHHEEMERENIPAELEAGLEGLAAGPAAARLFDNINRFPFRYIGQFVSPRLAFVAHQGDCQTLVGLFQEVARAKNIPFAVGSLQKRMLVPRRPIHGRTDQSNTDDARYWYFQEHYWAISNGTSYDLLFMSSPRPQPILEQAERKHDGVTYYAFAGDLCLIEPEGALKNDIRGQGRVFDSEDLAKGFIDHHKKK